MVAGGVREVPVLDLVPLSFHSRLYNNAAIDSCVKSCFYQRRPEGKGSSAGIERSKLAARFRHVPGSGKNLCPLLVVDGFACLGVAAA